MRGGELPEVNFAESNNAVIREIIISNRYFSKDKGSPEVELELVDGN